MIDTGEAFFCELVESIPQMVWTKDANGRNAYCNRQLIDYMHVSMDEFLNNSWNVAHPDDILRGQSLWRTAVSAGTTYEAELRLRPKHSKTYRWFLVRAVPHRDASGHIDKWFGTTTDIDAQRRAFAALDFLAQSGSHLAGVQTVDVVLDRLAHASLTGLADMSIFDLEENGVFRRLVVTSPDIPASSVAELQAFGAPRPHEHHPIASVMQTGATLLVPQVDDTFIGTSIADERRQDAWRTLDIRSFVCAPMIVPGRVLGTVTLLRTGVSVPFEPPEVNVIEEVARRAAVAIDAIRLGDRDLQTARNMQTFADMGESVAASVGLAATLDAAMRVIVPARVDWAYINLTDEHGDLRLAAVYHPDDATRRMISQHIGTLYDENDRVESATREVLRTHAPVFMPYPSYARGEGVVNRSVLDVLWRAGLTSFAVVPLFSGATVRGTINLCMSTEARALTNDDVAFFQEYARRLGPVIGNAELFERERRVARSFQAAALPASMPNVPGFAFDAMYEAGKAESLVGGDWYDVFLLNDGRFVISIGDVAGSGLSAAVTMACVRQALRGAAHVQAEPVVMLAAADRALLDPQERFVTAFVGVVDPRTLMLTYHSAGHPPARLRMPDGDVIELASGGPPLGLFAQMEHEVAHTVHVPPGALLVLYTDGLTESTRNVLEGDERLRNALRSGTMRAAEHPAQRLHDAILADGSHDDVAILTLSVL